MPLLNRRILKHAIPGAVANVATEQGPSSTPFISSIWLPAKRSALPRPPPLSTPSFLSTSPLPPSPPPKRRSPDDTPSPTVTSSLLSSPASTGVSTQSESDISSAAATPSTSLSLSSASIPPAGSPGASTSSRSLNSTSSTLTLASHTSGGINLGESSSKVILGPSSGDGKTSAAQPTPAGGDVASASSTPALSDEGLGSSSSPSQSPVVATVLPTTAYVNGTFTSTSLNTFTTGASSTPTVQGATSNISHSSTTFKTAIIAGVVGGVGGLMLLTMLGVFFCVRRRRRKHAKAKMIDWQSVGPSVFRSPSNSPIPHTPKSSSHSVHSSTPLSPSLSHMTHSSSQYATAQENAYSPTRLGTARTNISPLLIVQSPSKSEESYHGHDEEYDPFADSLSMARMRPQMAAASPTIRVSDATLVDQAWAAKGLAQKTGGAAGLLNGAFRESPDELLMPPPPLNPVLGRPNRLSNDSLQPALQEEESAYSGVAM